MMRLLSLFRPFRRSPDADADAFASQLGRLIGLYRNTVPQADIVRELRIHLAGFGEDVGVAAVSHRDLTAAIAEAADTKTFTTLRQVLASTRYPPDGPPNVHERAAGEVFAERMLQAAAWRALQVLPGRNEEESR